MELLNEKIVKLLREAGVSGEIELSSPPNAEMGDLAFACFGLAKEWKMNPAEAAKKLKLEIGNWKLGAIERIEAVGPYVNFFINPQELARLVFKDKKEKIKKRKGKIMVEFAHPNTHKPVHIGHLRNMVTGESLVRILENQGHKVVRANYQGDVGMHIAKCLWGILENPKSKILNLKSASVDERAKWLGEMYAKGGQAYEKDKEARKEIEEINEKIYTKSDKDISKLYKETRKWSLDYFDYIYKKVGVKKFDRLYFESEVFVPGKKIVLAGLKTGVFKKSQGAMIFGGSKFGLHDRVFVNSKGFPTYEAKDLALANLQFKEFKPEKILHVVAREQADYFKVLFKALEFTLPKSKGKEEHLIYGWVSLKEGKMSSRTGNVVLAEWLLDEVEKRIAEIMRDREIRDKKKVIEKITNAAVKYSMLKTGIGNDIAFDFNESISLSGDSGPYLLYIVARINSILRKSKIINLPAGVAGHKSKISELKIDLVEKKLLLELAGFDETVREAAEGKDPSIIAKYLFGLAQGFNNFYQSCPVLEAEPVTRNFRLQLIKKVREVMGKGLGLLGIEVVEEM